MWLSVDFDAPVRIAIPGISHHLRQISPNDTELDMVAVMGSRPRLWSVFGKAWAWPTADMTVEQDQADLERHANEMERNESFDYALFDEPESALLGCVYIDPPGRVGSDADVAWWVVDSLVGSDIETALDEFVPSWIAIG